MNKLVVYVFQCSSQAFARFFIVLFVRIVLCFVVLAFFFLLFLVCPILKHKFWMRCVVVSRCVLRIYWFDHCHYILHWINITSHGKWIECWRGLENRLGFGLMLSFRFDLKLIPNIWNRSWIALWNQVSGAYT